MVEVGEEDQEGVEVVEGEEEEDLGLHNVEEGEDR